MVALSDVVPSLLVLWLLHPLFQPRCRCPVKLLWRFDVFLTTWLPLMLLISVFYGDRYDVWVASKLGLLCLRSLAYTIRLTVGLMRSLSLIDNNKFVSSLVYYGYTTFNAPRILCQVTYTGIGALHTFLRHSKIRNLLSASHSVISSQLPEIPSGAVAFRYTLSWAHMTFRWLILCVKVALCSSGIAIILRLGLTSFLVDRLIAASTAEEAGTIQNDDETLTIVDETVEGSINTAEYNNHLTLHAGDLDLFYTHFTRRHGLVDWDAYPLTIIDFNPYESSALICTDPKGLTPRLFMRFDMLMRREQLFRYLELIIEAVPSTDSSTVFHVRDEVHGVRLLGIQIHAVRAKQSDTGDTDDWDCTWQWDTSLAARFTSFEERFVPEDIAEEQPIDDFREPAAYTSVVGDVHEEDDSYNSLLVTSPPSPSSHDSLEAVVTSSNCASQLPQALRDVDAGPPGSSGDVATFADASIVFPAPTDEASVSAEDSDVSSGVPSVIHLPSGHAPASPSLSTQDLEFGRSQVDLGIAPLLARSASKESSVAESLVCSPAEDGNASPTKASPPTNVGNETVFVQNTSPGATPEATIKKKPTHRGAKRGAQMWRAKMKQLAAEAVVEATLKAAFMADSAASA